jgi:hypothetical protein
MRRRALSAFIIVTLVLTTMTSVRAQADVGPSWVPQTVNGWNLAYSDTFTSSPLTYNTNRMKSNWTQVWYKNTTTNLDAVVGVVTLELNAEDLLGQRKLANMIRFQEFEGFDGSTNWDLFKYLLNSPSSISDKKFTEENIPGVTNAVSIDFTIIGWDTFHFLIACKGPYVTFAFALKSPADFWTWLNAENYSAMYTTWIRPYTPLIANYFITVLNVFLLIIDIGEQPNSPETATESTGSILTYSKVPTASAQTPEQNVRDFTELYMNALSRSFAGIPVLLLAVASVTAVILNMRKRKMINA